MRSPSSAYTAREQASKIRPLEIFHFWTVDSDQHWRYTSGDVTVVHDSQTYTPAPISRSAVSGGAGEHTQMTVNAPMGGVTLIDFLEQKTGEPVWAEIGRLHREDLNEKLVIFIGQVAGIGFSGLDAAIECGGLDALLATPIPRDRFSPGCQNDLYDERCGVDDASFSTAAVLSSVSADGLTLVSATFALQDDDYYRMGFVAYGGIRRMVTGHTGDTIVLRSAIYGLAAAATVTVYAGCDYTRTTCRDKFANLDNFFGHPDMPEDNPCANIN